MPFSARVFLIYFLFVGLTAYFVLRTVMDEIKPGVRQSTEETLVDTANLLAELVRDDVQKGTLAQSAFARDLNAYGKRKPNADISGLTKQDVNHRITITDGSGVVLLDSAGLDVGKDYSRWNDVYRTLRGQYGARMSRTDPADEKSTVMVVAAPIQAEGKIIGVVSVAKPSRAIQPYIDRSQNRLQTIGLALIALSLTLGLLFALGLNRSLKRLSHYALAVSEDRHATPPPMTGNDEISLLTRALEKMRVRLEGKAYVENYVHTLTHEMKSPLAAIRGSAELIDAHMPEAQRQRFLANIRQESLRLENLIQRLLELAQIEQRRSLDKPEALALRPLIENWQQTHQPRLSQRGLTLSVDIASELRAFGEAFLLRQALANLLENALDFSRSGTTITVHAESDSAGLLIQIHNQGEAIPDYALPRLFERFYSLPRPGTERKSTGLGLAFVQHVAKLHGGSITLRNEADGVTAELRLP